MTYNTNTDTVLGNDMFLYITSGSSDEVVAFATSCSLEVNGEQIDTSNKMSCKWQANLGGQMSYTISADALYTQKSGAMSFDALMQLMLAGEPVGWKMGKCKDATDCSTATFELDTTTSGLTYYSGTATITSLSLSAGNNEIASCSISLTGSGALTPTTIA